MGAGPGDEMEEDQRHQPSDARLAGEEAAVERSSEEEGVNALLSANVVASTSSAAAAGDVPHQREMPLDPASQKRVCYDHVHAEGGCVRWGCRYAHVACPRGSGGEGGKEGRRGGEGRDKGGQGDDDDQQEEARPRYVPAFLDSKEGRGGKRRTLASIPSLIPNLNF